jgi:hypothetical protein
MKMEIAFPALGMKGTVKNSTVVFFKQMDETVARAKVRPANPRSVDQTKVRGYVSLATKAWDDLTQAQRDAWLKYAKVYFSVSDDGTRVRPSGLTTFTRANVIRQILGLSLISDAPLEAPPARPTGLRQSGSPNPDSLGFELDHGITTVAGYRVLVRATPAMVTLGRTPRPADCAYVCGLSPASAAALPASGGTVTFSPTKYIVDPDQRYGLEVRIVRIADGMVSGPVFRDFIKQG